MPTLRNRYTQLVTFGASLLLLGDALLYVGLSGDISGWTKDSAYGSNVLAGATGGCFGIPLALFLLSVLNSWQEDLRGERRTSRLRKRAVRDLLLAEDGSVWASAGAALVKDASPLVYAVLAGYYEIFTREESPRSRVPRSDDEMLQPERLATYRDWLTRSIRNLEEAQAILNRLGSSEYLNSEWSARQARWRFLDGVVRERVFETETPWLSATNYQRLQEVFDQEIHPLLPVASHRDQQIATLLNTLRDLDQDRRDDPPRGSEQGLSIEISSLRGLFRNDFTTGGRAKELERIVHAFTQTLSENSD